MIQHYIKNNKYEILTPNGWEDFQGIIFNQSAEKDSKKIMLSDGSSVTATLEHRFFVHGCETRVCDLVIGDKLDNANGPLAIIGFELLVLSDTYEIYNAENHVIFANKNHSHQCDEFAYVPPNVASEFWTSISPTLATGGKALITSTPNSDEDQFAQIWFDANRRNDEFGNEGKVGVNGFSPYKAIWSAHPDRDEKWAREEEGRIGEERFKREHNAEFLIYDETLIKAISLAKLESKDPIMKMGQCRWYKKINARHTYIVSLDPSLGTGSDPAAIQVIEIPSFVQVAEWSHNLTPIQGQVRLLRDVCKYISEECTKQGTQVSLYYSVENNSIGEAALVAINEIGEESIPGLFLSEPIKKGHSRRFRKGFNTTHVSKVAICAKLKHLIESDRLKLHSKSLISELKTFVAAGASFAAKAGAHDDLVSALLLAVRMIMLLQDWDPVIYDKMREELEGEYDMPLPIYITSYK